MTIKCAFTTGTVALVLSTAIFGGASRAAEPAEKKVHLLLGFERKEMRKIIESFVSKRKTTEQNAEYFAKCSREDGPDRVTYSIPGAKHRIPIKKGDATQGEWAVAYVIDRAGWSRGSSGYRPGIYKRIFNHATHDVFHTIGAFGEVRSLLCRLPNGRDWSGYDRLWVDVKSGLSLHSRALDTRRIPVPSLRGPARVPRG